MFWLIAFIGIAISFSCTRKDTLVSVDHSAVQIDSTLGLIVADTITYEVVIHNTNSDDKWTEACLSNLNHQALIDNIFDMIYQGSAYAYHYETAEQLTVRQLKKMENETGFNRNEIGMIQFTEIWYLHPENSSLTKQVHSMVLGYNFYTSDGEHLGYKPLFNVKLEKQLI